MTSCDLEKAIKNKEKTYLLLVCVLPLRPWQCSERLNTCDVERLNILKSTKQWGYDAL